MNWIVLYQPLREGNKIIKIVNIYQTSSVPDTVLNGLHLSAYIILLTASPIVKEVYNDRHFTDEETERRFALM